MATNETGTTLHIAVDAATLELLDRATQYLSSRAHGMRLHRNATARHVLISGLEQLLKCSADETSKPTLHPKNEASEP